jgi:O-antigen/teichoic acid export membrane protein
MRRPSESTTVEARQFLTHSLAAGVGTLLAGGLGFLLQAAVSHRFSPAQFGGAFVVLSLVTVVSFMASPFTRLIVWNTSRDTVWSDGQSDEHAALLRATHNSLRLVGVGLAVACWLVAPLIAGFLRVPGSFVVAGALGLPFALPNSILMGELQGEQRFVTWALLSIGQALAKLSAAVAFGIAFGATGVLLGISVATAVTYAITWALVRHRLRPVKLAADWRRARAFVLITAPSTLVVTGLLSTDVILVKHLFPAHAAGQYAAVAALGRAIFWGMGGLTGVVFAKVGVRDAQRRSTFGVVTASVGLALLCGVAGLLIFTLTGKALLTAFAGKNYASGESYVGVYALGMTLFGAVAVMINALQSLGRTTLLWVTLPLSLIEPALILLYHSSLLQVVQMMDVSMGIFVVALAILYVFEERARLTGVPPPNPRPGRWAPLKPIS